MLIFVIILVAALTFVPALALGPIATRALGEALLMARRSCACSASRLGMVVLMTVLLGILYPLVMTGAAQALFPGKADGSLVKLDGKVVGSELAGQVFTSPAYFHSRPSATTPAVQPVGHDVRQPRPEHAGARRRRWTATSPPR